MGSSVLARIFRDYCSEHEVRVPSDSNENDTVLYKVLSEEGVRACERIVDTIPWQEFKFRKPAGKRAYLAQCKAELDKLPFLPSSRGKRVWDARAAAVYLHDVESTDSGGGTGEEPHYSLKDSRGKGQARRRWSDMPDKEQRKVLKDVMDGHGELFSHSHADSLLLDSIFKEQQQIHQQQPQLDLTQR